MVFFFLLYKEICSETFPKYSFFSPTVKSIWTKCVDDNFFLAKSSFYLIDWLILIRQSMSREEGILVGFILLLWMLTLTIFFQRWGRRAVCRILISLEWIPIQKGYESAIIDGGTPHPPGIHFPLLYFLADFTLPRRSGLSAEAAGVRAMRHLCGHAGCNAKGPNIRAR